MAFSCRMSYMRPLLLPYYLQEQHMFHYYSTYCSTDPNPFLYNGDVNLPYLSFLVENFETFTLGLLYSNTKPDSQLGKFSFEQI